MNDHSLSTTAYTVRRLTIEVQSTPSDLRTRYERAVPRYPVVEVAQLVDRHAPWSQMVELIDAAAPFGFLIYNTIDADSLMHLAGDEGSCVTYLMGNHTIAERMFRREPLVMLHAPLRIAIWSTIDGPTRLTFDLPSDHFASFGNPDIAAVGAELDRKVAVLLGHLHVHLPSELLANAADKR
ncbi:MAG: hypothetical protein JWM76_4409 [Pseudonocardiales bacterium]|nr:hypothetical protein [Pseudonocardiales bacterium]